MGSSYNSGEVQIEGPITITGSVNTNPIGITDVSGSTVNIGTMPHYTEPVANVYTLTLSGSGSVSFNPPGSIKGLTLCCESTNSPVISRADLDVNGQVILSQQVIDDVSVTVPVENTTGNTT